MGVFDKEIDVARNIQTIEILKSKLLKDVSNLFEDLVDGINDDVHSSIIDKLSNIILISYLLGRRLGINYNAVGLKIENKMKLGLLENDNIEKNYGDISELMKYFNYMKSKK